MNSGKAGYFYADHYDLSRRFRRGSTILEAATLEPYQPTPVTEQAFKNLSLGTKVHATLIASSNVRGLALEVSAQGGHVPVTGRVDHEALKDEIVKLVNNIPGVIRVTTNVYAVPPETLMGP